MAGKKSGLGRGLDALLGPMTAMPAAETAVPVRVSPVPGPVSIGTPAPAATASVGDGLRRLPLGLLQPGVYQPRRDMHKETLEELAESIRSQGVLAPISVRPVAGEGGAQRYEIIAGERRWRAAQLAGLSEIPVIVRHVTNEQAAAIALIENLQREDLNPIEEAEGLRRLIEEFDLTHQEAGRAVGKSRAAVSNLIRLLELAPEVLKLLAAGELDMGHARALLALSGARSQIEAAREVIDRGLSVRETEALVKRLQSGRASKAGTKASHADRLDPDIRRLQDDLSSRLGASIAIQHSVRGKGKLIISYNSTDELEGILAHIK